ncbi:MAG: hypothetical protein Tsb0015_04640 [Simkaniaceae bacterium]
MFAAVFSFFIIQYSTTLPFPQEDNPIIFYSGQNRQDLKLLYCKALQQALSSIYISSFGLSDPQIFHWILRKAENLVPITIACHPKEIRKKKKKYPENVEFVPMKTSGISHEKILLIDDKYLFLGSANLTNTSLAVHDNLVIGLCSPKLAKQFKQRGPQTFFHENLGDEHLSFYFLPEKNDQCLNALLQRINEAQEEIKIAMFTLTHPGILDALKQAKERKLHIEIIMDRYSAAGCCRKTLDFLQQNNISVRQSQLCKLMHHKWALIDNKYFITGSANWTRSAFSKNYDYIIIFNKINKKHKLFINKIWNKLIKESK